MDHIPQVSVLLLLLFLIFPQIGSAETTRDEIDSWTWSEDIVRGNYTWQVSTFIYDSETVVTRESSDDLIEGSNITLVVNEDLHGTDFLAMDFNESLDIDIYFDGSEVEQHPRYPIEFLYPSLVGWTNGTYDNLFRLDQPEFRDILNFSDNARIEDEYYIIEYSDQYQVVKSTRQISTGILQSSLFQTSNNHLEYTYVGFEPADDSFFERLSISYVSIIAFILVLPVIWSKIVKKRKNAA